MPQSVILLVNSLQCSQALVDLYNFTNRLDSLSYDVVIAETGEGHKQSYCDIPQLSHNPVSEAFTSLHIIA